MEDPRMMLNPHQGGLGPNQCPRNTTRAARGDPETVPPSSPHHSTRPPQPRRDSVLSLAPSTADFSSLEGQEVFRRPGCLLLALE